MVSAMGTPRLIRVLYKFCAVLLLCGGSVCLSLRSPASLSSLPSLSLGFDFGTSGVRCTCIDTKELIVYEDAIGWTSLGPDESVASSTEYWRAGLHALMERIPDATRSKVQRICVSGTSASCIMYDVQRQVVTREPRMYNFNVLKSSSKGPEALEVIANKSPMGSSVRAATSTLPKLLSWHMESPVGESERLMCQADYVAHQLLSADDKPEMVLRSDWHNALKLGYDVRTLQYPDWLYGLLKDTGIKAECLPAVSQPGSVYKTVSKQIADRYGLPQGCEVVAGTTDSIAAFLAAGVSKTGQAVTSLGSTLAVKLLSDVYCEDSDRGVYSHRLGDMWLVGGASNVGCKILRQEKFSNDELAALSEGIDPAIDSPLGRTFYPLPEAGERFPVYDPSKEPVLAPKPASRGEYLHGILQSIAHIEDDGYRALVELGASPVTEVRTCGGGAANDKWAAIRQRLMGVPVTRAPNTDAAYGCARLGILYAGNNADKETPIEAAPAALQ